MVPQHRSDGLSDDHLRVDESDSHSNEHSGSSDGVSVTESDYGQWSPCPIESESGQDDSSDLGEVERERVRRIFREWMNTGARERTSNISQRSNGSRGEWLGENEQERVRIIREWVQMNSRQRGACVSHTDEQGGEVTGQIEQVLDGLVVNPNEGRTEHTRRGIRRLCGRQALLDMLKKAERERQSEIQGLLEHRAVSQFAHRNRIQSLLRGRFLRNDRMIEDDRPTSTAARELGILRQRHTVSDLREGFFSRLDRSVCSQLSSNTSDTPSNTDINGNIIEPNNAQHEQSNNHGLPDGRTDVAGNITGGTQRQESTASFDEESGQVSENELRDGQLSANVGIVESRESDGQEENGNWQEGCSNESSSENMENGAGEHTHDFSTNDIFSQRSDPNTEETSAPMISNYVGSLEGSGAEDANGHEFMAEAEQNHVLESEVSIESNGWRDGVQDDLDTYQPENIGNEWLENDDREGSSEVWHEDGFQEAEQSWLGEPSDQESGPVGRMSPFYAPDDDNVYSMELRELLSRRSVSTLLRSGFRESLDQLIRSYVERQNHAPLDWELQGSSPTPVSAEQDFELQDGSQNEGPGDVTEIPPLSLTSPPMPPVQQLWEQESHHYSWPQHDMHQRFGIEWDIINDLRIDMARLQQRMNNMQRMLEACMDMQLELQRSIRQEVSAALNRPPCSPGVCENSSPEDTSKWDHVRKGMCCICCDSGIDSLLYRCGHMCTCSKCANELVQSGEKCPMCRAPVVEVIRAYSIL